MPFEPLRTDEKIEGKKPKATSMDDLMLSGCTGFVGCSIGTFLLGVWPFLLFGSTEPVRPAMLLGFPVGLIPASIFGAYTCRRFGLASACGFVGGAMALGVFMFLVSNRLATAIFLASGPRHFYSPAVVYLIPVVWLVLALAVGYVFTPKSELRFWKP
jgi:hypothetical protein